MRAEQPCHLGELRIVHPDLGWAGQAAARLDHRLVALLLLGAHLVERDLGIAAERRSLGERLASFPGVDLDSEPPSVSERPPWPALHDAGVRLRRRWRFGPIGPRGPRPA